MKAIICVLLLGGIAIAAGVDAKSYVPLSELDASSGTNHVSSRVVGSDARPFLPGMRPVEVELLEDALRRKQPRTIGDSRVRAHESIIRNSLRDPIKRSHMKGILAEALYLQKNPEWGYVRSPIASQHDIYTWVPGRQAPFNAQIKTHASADPTVYARDMVSDHRSNLFVVPDDHVGPLRDHWRSQLREYQARGQTTDAIEASRQLARVRGLGYSSKELDDHLSRAARYCLRERNAAYVSLGAGVAMAIGPDLWEWWRTGSPSDRAAYRAVRTGSILAAERATTLALGKVGTGALRGTLRGNIVTGVVILTTDTAFSIYENGGAGAFRSAGFYNELGGGIGGLALAFPVGALVAVNVTGWTTPVAGGWAPVLGGAAGLASGAVAAMAGYVGGKSTTRTILEAIDPGFLHDAETTAFKTAKDRIASSIVCLQRDNTKGCPSRI